MKAQVTPTRVVIQGITRKGTKFRPSDWAERLQDCIATHGVQNTGRIHNCMSASGLQRKASFSPYVHVSFSVSDDVEGVKSLVIEHELWETKPKDYEFLMNFAKANDLNVVEEWEEIRKAA
jgi:hypothetical protein